MYNSSGSSVEIGCGPHSRSKLDRCLQVTLRGSLLKLMSSSRHKSAARALDLLYVDESGVEYQCPHNYD